MIQRTAYLPLRKIHPCPKPVEEMQFLVESLTRPGQIILDCCCGTGSTLLAAEMTNRQWIGCDLSKRYCQIAMKRLAVIEGACGQSDRHFNRWLTGAAP